MRERAPETTSVDRANGLTTDEVAFLLSNPETTWKHYSKLGESERGQLTASIFGSAHSAALDEGDPNRGREAWEAKLASRQSGE
ncbi:MAG: hypothetical protein ABIG66_01725 [Candidatus Kerfeldbacteria bacterium]